MIRRVITCLCYHIGSIQIQGQPMKRVLQLCRVATVTLVERTTTLETLVSGEVLRKARGVPGTGECTSMTPE
jgi:hypothetical protein